MAEINTTDTIDNTTLTGDHAGFHAVRKIIVTGLTNAQGHLRMYDATQVTGMPKYGDQLAGIPGPIVVSGISAIGMSTTSAEVTVTYDPIGIPGLTQIDVSETVGADKPGGARLTITTGIQQVTTNRMPDGKSMIVLKHDFGAPRGVVEQPGTVQRFIPTTKLIFVRREPKSALVKVDDYRGRVDESWILGAPPRSWMCTRLNQDRIVGGTVDGKEQYEVAYEFDKATDIWPPGPGAKEVGGWDSVVVFVDPETNEPILEPVVGEGIKLLKYPRTARFAALNLLI